jgi:hypothetical protein
LPAAGSVDVLAVDVLAIDILTVDILAVPVLPGTRSVVAVVIIAVPITVSIGVSITVVKIAVTSLFVQSVLIHYSLPPRPKYRLTCDNSITALQLF